jgi:hypothetical protein
VKEGLPVHAWSAEGIRQALGDVCVFDHMEGETFRQEDTRVLAFYAWMADPDWLPRSKTVTIFAERAGRSSAGDGPPPLECQVASPPEGGTVVLLIHLDHYNDWTPPPARPRSSGTGGFPESSSDSSSDAPFPVFKSFAWQPGVLDGQQPPRRARPLQPQQRSFLIRQ